MMRRPATSLARQRIGLALGASLLLHLGILFGFAAPTPPSSYSAQRLSVHLVAAVPAAPRSAPQPVAIPVRYKIPPSHRHIFTRAVSHAVMRRMEPTPAEVPPTPPAVEPATSKPPGTTSNTAALSASTYYAGAQLDEPPRLLGEVQQVYPARARANDIEGSVTLSLLIDEHGRVDNVSVVSAHPSGYFEKAALDMLRKQRFTPALIHNHPVKSRWRTVVRYRLRS